jgi:hypothetical protein
VTFYAGSKVLDDIMNGEEASKDSQSEFSATSRENNEENANQGEASNENQISEGEQQNTH